MPTTEKIDYEGWPNCIRLTNGDTELIIVSAVGPRLIRYGFLDGPNAFHVDPKTAGQSGDDKWVGYGGHRLWHAPEVDGRSNLPDNAPVESTILESGIVHVSSPPEAETGIKKEMFIALAPTGSAVQVRHRLTNHGLWDVALAPWGLSIVANGGRVVLPQETYAAHKDEVDPARPLVLWKFTDMADPRWRWGTRYITLRQDDTAGEPQKVGLYNSHGWGAHITPRQAFIIDIAVDPKDPTAYTDFGCNFETYTEGPFQELETLGPLVTLKPGASVDHVEHWYLAKAENIADNDDSLDRNLLPLVNEARSAAAKAFGGN